ncbi:MAG: FAD-binding oxidoreductase [Vicinamibacterales bacterium]
MPTPAAIAAFRSALRGDLIEPTDPRYDEARQVYNAMIDKRPALIAEVANVGDVVTAVNFARTEKMLLAVQSGGHNAGGLGSCDGGLVIKLGRMKGVRYDPVTKTARVEGGCTWGDIDHALHAFGRAVPAGIVSTTGVGGLTLGGGIGHLTRGCGLTIDNLLEADVVLATGELVTANAKKHADLFWAIRGGGGNFGVVTSFLFRTHPVHTNYAGPMLYELSEAPDVLTWYRSFIVKAPKELTGFFAFLTVPPGPPFPAHLHLKKMCGIVWCYSGPLRKAEKIFKPIRARRTPALDLVGPIPHPVLQSLFDGLLPPGDQWYWKADFVETISDEAIALHAKHGALLPSMQSTMHLYPIDGVASKVKNSATPWAYRKAHWAEVIVGVDHDAAKKPELVKWARDYWNALHPHCAPGAYINFMMADEGQERIQATYQGNYKRLRQVKRKYDPKNLFRVNQNIAP